MAQIRYSDSASIDVIVALKTIQRYFIERESPGLGEKHISLFKAELKDAERTLAAHPELYPIRKEYSPSRCGRMYRSFAVHWFIVFYTYSPMEGVIIWYIRPAKSDYSDIILFP